MKMAKGTVTTGHKTAWTHNGGLKWNSVQKAKTDDDRSQNQDYQCRRAVTGIVPRQIEAAMIAARANF